MPELAGLKQISQNGWISSAGKAQRSTTQRFVPTLIILFQLVFFKFVALNLVSIALLAAVHNVAWWSVHIWDSNNSNGCDHFISMMLYKGACTESSYGASSTSNCVSFTDSSYWNTMDDYLNGETTSNTQDADMYTGASHYNTSGKLISAALAFCVISIVAHLVSALFVPIDFHKTMQLVNGGLVGLSILMIISAIAMSHNDLNNATYWELYWCPYPFSPNTTTANSYVTGPVFGYVLALFALLFQIISMSFLVTPGNCCFCCPCQQCCGCVEYKAPLSAQDSTPAMVSATVVSVQQPAPPVVVVGKVVDYA